MPRGPRAHRLPQRLDYALIPAPLDLSLPEASEKHPLPAIIVTPSSPTHEHDFGIAFLAPEKQPSLRERVVTFAKTHSPTLENFQLPSPPTSPLTYLSLRPNRPRFALGPSSKTFGLRTLFLPLLTLFVLAAHLLTHRLAARASHPHLDFHATLHLNSGLDKDAAPLNLVEIGAVAADGTASSTTNWLGAIDWIWTEREEEALDEREGGFVVSA